MAQSTNTVDFGSAGEEDYSEVHSPTDSSEDSVEVKVSPITSRNKRKCAEPRKVQDTFTGPLKKRMCLKVKAEVAESHPFRPWSPKPVPSKIEPPNERTKHESPSSSDLNIKSESSNPSEDIKTPVAIKRENFDNNYESDFKTQTNDKSDIPRFPLPSFIVPKVPIVYQPNLQINSHKYAYFRPPSPIRVPVEDQPVALIKKCEPKQPTPVKVKEECTNDTRLQIPQPLRVPIHPQITTLSTAETERLIINTAESFPSLHSKVKSDQMCSSRREQRNYKNMTRERRIEANARERTRVHTISAAFDTLRRSVPAYSHNQKLSKLSVLRIACSYIKTLSNIVEGNDEASSESVEIVSRTIQREGKLRKKKDDND